MQSPPKALPKVTVQVLHWRGLDKTRECLRSLLTVTYPELTVLLVVNGSDPGDSTALKTEFPLIEVLELDQNYGFAGGSNRGLERAIAGGADFVWLLNNDATVPAQTLLSLLEVAQANPGAGALGAAVLEGPTATAAVAGVGAISYLKAKTFLRKLPDPFAEPATDGAGKASAVTVADRPGVLSFHRCQWLSGSNLLLRTAALSKTGLFDERYFLYFEDVDLCLRLTKAGFACLLVPASTVRHEGNASTQGGLSLWRAYYHTRNRLIFFMQYAPPLSKPIALAAILAHFLRHCLSLPLKGRAGRAKLYAEWLGLSDYFQGRIGKATCLDWCEKISL